MSIELYRLLELKTFKILTPNFSLLTSELGLLYSLMDNYSLKEGGLTKRKKFISQREIIWLGNPSIPSFVWDPQTTALLVDWIWLGFLSIPSCGLLMHRGAELYPDGLLRKHVAQRNANNRCLGRLDMARFPQHPILRTASNSCREAKRPLFPLYPGGFISDII